jgi:hypothetical protein
MTRAIPAIRELTGKAIPIKTIRAALVASHDGEWHHTGGCARCTDFYSINAAIEQLAADGYQAAIDLVGEQEQTPDIPDDQPRVTAEDMAAEHAARRERRNRMLDDAHREALSYRAAALDDAHEDAIANEWGVDLPPQTCTEHVWAIRQKRMGYTLYRCAVCRRARRAVTDPERRTR